MSESGARRDTRGSVRIRRRAGRDQVPAPHFPIPQPQPMISFAEAFIS
jgi:hypothetical protein